MEQRQRSWLGFFCAPIWSVWEYFWSSDSQKFKRYTFGDVTVRVLRQVGEGGFSFVYVAEEIRNPGKIHALKMIRAQNPEQLSNAKREIEMQNKLHHPNLLPLENYSIIDQKDQNETELILLLFPYYPVTYFVIVIFNFLLCLKFSFPPPQERYFIICSTSYASGEEVLF